MRARDLAEPYPAVSADDDAVTAARLFVERRLPALLVLDADQRPYAIVPGSQLLRVVLPDYALEDSAQALALHDTELERLAEKLEGLTVAQWLPHRTLPTVVGPDTGIAQVAALMIRTHAAGRGGGERRPGNADAGSDHGSPADGTLPHAGMRRV